MAKIYGNLERAQLETLTSDLSASLTGAIWWDSTLGQIRLSDGTNVRSVLRNDAKAVFGNHGTAANNIRFHRGASGVLQFVAGNDATAEGTLSTSLAQTSARLENYTNAGKPAAGNAGRLAWISDLAGVYVDTGAAWSAITGTSGLDSSLDIKNAIIVAQINTPTAGDLTLTLKTKAAATPSGGDPVSVNFRNASAFNGDYFTATVTSALSIVIPNGATLGHKSATSHHFYVYLVYNQDTSSVQLAVTSRWWGASYLSSPSALSTSSDSASAIYTDTTSASAMPARAFARIFSNQTTAGTWSTQMSNIILAPFASVTPFMRAYGNLPTGTIAASWNNIKYGTVVTDTHNGYDASTGGYTVKETGWYTINGGVVYSDTGGWTAGDNIYLGIAIDGSITFSKRNNPPSVSGDEAIVLSATILVNAGSTISLRSYSTTGASAFSGDASGNFFTVVKSGDNL